MTVRIAPWAIIVCFSVALLAAGCGSSEEIRSYDVPKTTDATKPVSPDKYRLLGAIIPVGEVSWFVKFSGPADKIDPHAASFDAFLASVRVTPDMKKPITFTIPAGWQEAPPRQMRYASFQIGDDKTAPGPYISTPFGGDLLANVNRWRGEAGLKDVTPADLPKVTTEIMLGDTKAYKIDIRGPGGKGGGMAPFMGK